MEKRTLNPELPTSTSEYDDLHRVPTCTAAENRALGFRVRAGDEAARERMILGNRRIVYSVVNKYVSRWPAGEDDLISEGTIGLMGAVDKFDPSVGHFATYCYYAIDGAVKHAIERQRRTVRVPKKTLREIATLLREGIELPEDLAKIEAGGATVQLDQPSEDGGDPLQECIAGPERTADIHYDVNRAIEAYKEVLAMVKIRNYRAEEILAMHLEGFDPKEIARTLELRYHEVHRLVKSFGDAIAEDARLKLAGKEIPKRTYHKTDQRIYVNGEAVKENGLIQTVVFPTNTTTNGLQLTTSPTPGLA